MIAPRICSNDEVSTVDQAQSEVCHPYAPNTEAPYAAGNISKCTVLLISFDPGVRSPSFDVLTGKADTCYMLYHSKPADPCELGPDRSNSLYFVHSVRHDAGFLCTREWESRDGEMILAPLLFSPSSWKEKAFEGGLGFNDENLYCKK